MLSLTLLLALVATAAPTPTEQRPAPASPLATETNTGERIVWYGTLAAGLAEAERTQRPIFLQSAAPRCREVPGAW